MNVFSKYLRKINGLPFPVTAKHYVSFGHPSTKFKNGELRSGDSWMVLRDEHPSYRIPDSREEWLRELSLNKDGQDSRLMERVVSFAQFLDREGIKTVYSIGSGGGVFEYYLKKHSPHIRVVATEYEIEAVDRLRRVCTELDDVLLFDALDAHSWQKISRDESSIVFINRNEREFSDEQWRKIWHDMHAAGVKRVFLGLMWTLTILSFVQQKCRNFQKRLRGERVSFAGFIRSFAGLEHLWRGKYVEQERIPFPNCTGVYLLLYTEPQ